MAAPLQEPRAVGRQCAVDVDAHSAWDALERVHTHRGGRCGGELLGVAVVAGGLLQERALGCGPAGDGEALAAVHRLQVDAPAPASTACHFLVVAGGRRPLDAAARRPSRRRSALEQKLAVQRRDRPGLAGDAVAAAVGAPTQGAPREKVNESQVEPVGGALEHEVERVRARQSRRVHGGWLGSCSSRRCWAPLSWQGACRSASRHATR